MIAAYYAIGKAIKEQVKAIQWIDIDKGQLDNPDIYNSIIVPGVLVGLANIDWEQLAGGWQEGKGTLTVKTVFVLQSQTHLTDPLLSQALEQLNLASDVTDSVLSIPGITQRLNTREYPSDTYYVIEETFAVSLKSGPTYTQKQVQVDVNPILYKPSTL